MKRVIITWFVLLLTFRLSAQLVTSAPVHEGISMLGFLNSIEQALASTEELTKVLGVGRETAASLQDIKNQMEEINRYLLQAQEIEYAIRDIADMGSMLNEFGRAVARSYTSFYGHENEIRQTNFCKVLIIKELW